MEALDVERITFEVVSCGASTPNIRTRCHAIAYLGREDYRAVSGCLALHRWRLR